MSAVQCIQIRQHIKLAKFQVVKLSEVEVCNELNQSILKCCIDAGPPPAVLPSQVAPTSLVRLPSAVLSDLAIELLQFVVPVVVVRTIKRYRCIGGFQTLALARSRARDENPEVRVLVLSGRYRKLANETALASLLVAPYMLSWVWLDPQRLGAFWTSLDEAQRQTIERLIPGLSTPSALARARNVQLRTMFPKRAQKEPAVANQEGAT